MEEEKTTQDYIKVAQEISLLKIENIKIRNEINHTNIECEELHLRYKKIVEEKKNFLSHVISLKEENKRINELILKLKDSDYIRNLEKISDS